MTIAVYLDVKQQNKQAKQIMPRGHMETGPSISSYFVAISLEYPKASCLIWILAQW